MQDPKQTPVEPIDLNDRRRAASFANGIVSLYAARLQASRAIATRKTEPRPVIRFGRGAELPAAIRDTPPRSE